MWFSTDNAVAAPSPEQTGVAALSPNAMIEDERNSVSVYEAMAPATVFVTQNQRMLEAFTRKPLEVASGSGTGFIWDTEGHIVTNFHVVAGASSLRVTLQNQESYEATLVGGEPRRDLAVLKIEAPAEQLVPVRRMPRGSRLMVGQKAIAIGNPFGLDHTLTTGVVSALDREVQGYGGVTIPGMI
jgi:S1-C subfamily serine protease